MKQITDELSRSITLKRVFNIRAEHIISAVKSLLHFTKKVHLYVTDLANKARLFGTQSVAEMITDMTFKRITSFKEGRTTIIKPLSTLLMQIIDEIWNMPSGFGVDQVIFALLNRRMNNLEMFTAEVICDVIRAKKLRIILGEDTNQNIRLFNVKIGNLRAKISVLDGGKEHRYEITLINGEMFFVDAIIAIARGLYEEIKKRNNKITKLGSTLRSIAKEIRRQLDEQLGGKKLSKFAFETNLMCLIMCIMREIARGVKEEEIRNRIEKLARSVINKMKLLEEELDRILEGKREIKEYENLVLIKLPSERIRIILKDRAVILLMVSLTNFLNALKRFMNAKFDDSGLINAVLNVYASMPIISCVEVRKDKNGEFEYNSVRINFVTGGIRINPLNEEECKEFENNDLVVMVLNNIPEWSLNAFLKTLHSSLGEYCKTLVGSKSINDIINDLKTLTEFVRKLMEKNKANYAAYYMLYLVKSLIENQLIKWEEKLKSGEMKVKDLINGILGALRKHVENARAFSKSRFSFEKAIEEIMKLKEKSEISTRDKVKAIVNAIISFAERLIIAGLPREEVVKVIRYFGMELAEILGESEKEKERIFNEVKNELKQITNEKAIMRGRGADLLSEVLSVIKRFTPSLREQIAIRMRMHSADFINQLKTGLITGLMVSLEQIVGLLTLYYTAPKEKITLENGTEKEVPKLEESPIIKFINSTLPTIAWIIIYLIITPIMTKIIKMKELDIAKWRAGIIASAIGIYKCAEERGLWPSGGIELGIIMSAWLWVFDEFDDFQDGYERLKQEINPYREPDESKFGEAFELFGLSFLLGLFGAWLGITDPWSIIIPGSSQFAKWAYEVFPEPWSTIVSAIYGVLAFLLAQVIASDGFGVGWIVYLLGSIIGNIIVNMIANQMLSGLI